MDPASIVESVPTEYGFEGWIAGILLLFVVIGGGWMMRSLMKQNQKQQETALAEHTKDRESFEDAVREMNIAFTAAVTSMNDTNQRNSERLSDKIEHLAMAVRDLSIGRAANVR